MSWSLSLDKTTIATLTAFTIVLGYLAYVLAYPSNEVPVTLTNLLSMAVTFLFTTGGISLYIKAIQSQKAQ